MAKAKTKLTPYQRHVKAERKKGKTLKQISKTWRSKKMAKKRSSRRRKPVRRKVAARRKPAARRRVRRNAWEGQPRRHKKAATYGWKKRKAGKRGYARPKKARSGRYSVAGGTQARAARRRRYRKSYRGGQTLTNNAVLPYFAHNSMRRNSVLPYFAHNGPMDVAMSFTKVDFWTQEILPTAGGFLGTGLVSKQIRNLIGLQPSAGFDFAKHGVNLGSAALLGAASSMLFKNQQLSSRVVAGGLLYTFFGLLKDFLPAIGMGDLKEQLGLDNLAETDTLTEELKSRIASAVQDEMGVGAFLDTQALARAPYFGGTVNPGINGMGDFVTTQALDRAPDFAGGVVADLDDVVGVGAI